MPEFPAERKLPTIKKNLEQIRSLWKGKSIFVTDWLNRKYRLKKVGKTKNGLIVLARQEKGELGLSPKHVLLYYPKATQAKPFIQSTRDLQDFMSPGQTFPGALFSASYFIEHNHVKLNEVQGLFTKRNGHVTDEHVEPHKDANMDLLRVLFKNALKHGFSVKHSAILYAQAPTPHYFSELKGAARQTGLRVFFNKSSRNIEFHAFPPNSFEVPLAENYFGMMKAMDKGPEQFEKWQENQRRRLFKHLGFNLPIPKK